MKNNRYHRQMILPNFGETVQQKLKKCRVLVIGAGGLGCPVLIQLAGMGVGTIGIVDDDTVALNNLHRQHLYSEKSVGCYKSDEAKKILSALNSEIQIKSYPYRILNNNAEALISSYDIIVDGTDNFETRYMINDACVLFQKPLVYGAVYQYEGQVAVFNVTGEIENSCHYRDLFPIINKGEEIPTCNDAGAYGVLTGIIGNFMAHEVFKLVSNNIHVLKNKLLIFNLNHYRSEIFSYSKNNSNNFIPKNIEAFLAYNYSAYCQDKTILSIEQLKSILKLRESILIDVRNEEEIPEIENFAFIKIPISDLDKSIQLLSKYDPIVFVCAQGNRSAFAKNWAQLKFDSKNIYDFPQGVLGLNKMTYV